MSLPSDVDVTVVVPVYNPGEFIEPCIDSLVNQTLAADRVDLVFVDDGSTDATPQRLDDLAAATPNVRVFHEPNSGWPGRPRNIGIDNARGRYVFFCDHDDWLSLDALERMVRYADSTDADILIPKMAGHNRGVPRVLFRETMPDATVLTAPLMSSLTPHKLFRRGFLDAEKLRFPEGKRRLEDHVFVIAAYFRASRIAVLSDRQYYHHIRREDDANAAFDQVEPDVYYRYVREVIDVIEAHTEPGPERDVALDRPLIGSVFDRLRRSRTHLRYSEDFQRRLFDEARSLVLERYPPGYGEHLSLATRARLAALRDDRFDLITEINDRMQPVTATGVVSSVDRADAAWQIDFELRPAFEDGTPLRLFARDDGRWTVDPRLLPESMHDSFTASTDELEDVGLTVGLVSRAMDGEWILPEELTAAVREIAGDPDGAQELVLSGMAVLHTMSAAGGSPLPDGLWDVVARFAVLGIDVRTRLNVEEVALPEPDGGERVVPFLTRNGLLSVDVGGQRKKRKKARRPAEQ